MSEIFEAVMVICFGVSWPVSIFKSFTSRTARGKSLFFLMLILIGYMFGIAWKLTSGNISYVFWFYVLNAVMVTTDILLYLRNRVIDKKQAAEKRK